MKRSLTRVPEASVADPANRIGRIGDVLVFWQQINMTGQTERLQAADHGLGR
jgi:hypothetical protein